MNTSDGVTLEVYLDRLEESDQGTFGRFQFGPHIVFCGELPDRQNRPSISSIPAGTYSAVRTYSPRFGRPLYLVDSVSGRTGIRIHPANFMGDASKGWRSQLNGCIALGEALGRMGGQKALLRSAPAVRRFEEWARGRRIRLHVRNAYEAGV